jgi:hypothetical protein
MAGRCNLSMTTWLTENVLSSAKLGPLFIDLEFLPKYLFRHCTHLVCRTGDENFEVRLLGSLSLLKIGDHFLAFATSHQVDKLDFKDVAIILPERQECVTSNQFLAYRYQKTVDQDSDQVRAFDFSNAALANPGMKQDFFSADDFTLNEELATADFFLAFGCMVRDSDIVVTESYPFRFDEFKLSVTVLFCEFECPTSDNSLFRLKIIDGRVEGTNGASGGPVFAVCDRNGQSLVLFAGMIVRGSTEFLHFISAQTIHDFVAFHRRNGHI